MGPYLNGPCRLFAGDRWFRVDCTSKTAKSTNDIASKFDNARDYEPNDVTKHERKIF